MRVVSMTPRETILELARLETSLSWAMANDCMAYATSLALHRFAIMLELNERKPRLSGVSNGVISVPGPLLGGTWQLMRSRRVQSPIRYVQPPLDSPQIDAENDTFIEIPG